MSANFAKFSEAKMLSCHEEEEEEVGRRPSSEQSLHLSLHSSPGTMNRHLRKCTDMREMTHQKCVPLHLAHVNLRPSSMILQGLQAERTEILIATTKRITTWKAATPEITIMNVTLTPHPRCTGKIQPIGMEMT